MTVGFGPGRRSRGGWRSFTPSSLFTTSAASTRWSPLAGRSRNRVRAILTPRARRNARSSKKLEDAIEEEQAAHPNAKIEVWASDENRIGLKPITRGVWAPIGERPIALGHHRFEWLYVTGFVEPASGATVWNISNTISKPLFELMLADFAKSASAGKDKRIVLQLDNAGWHGPENLTIPDGIRLVFQPPYIPELQPAEHLSAFIDEPLANGFFETIDDLNKAVADRCVALIEQREMIRASTMFHWRPHKPAVK